MVVVVQAFGAFAVVFALVAIVVSAYTDARSRQRAPGIAKDLGWRYHPESGMPSAALEFPMLRDARKPKVLWLMMPPDTHDAVFRLNSRVWAQGSSGTTGNAVRSSTCAIVSHTSEMVQCSFVLNLSVRPSEEGAEHSDVGFDEADFRARFRIECASAEDPVRLVGPDFCHLLAQRPPRHNLEVHLGEERLLVVTSRIGADTHPELLAFATALRDTLP
jgi:hypothetical protein